MISRIRLAETALVLIAAVSLPMPGAQSGSYRGDAHEREFQQAVSYYNSGQFQAAADELESLVKTTPASFEIEELLGLVYSAQDKDRDAIAHFEKAVRLKPDSGPARANLGASLARLGKNDLAEEAFKKAMQLQPDDFNVNHNFGEFYARAGKAKEAIPYLLKAEQADPSSYGNSYDLAVSYVEAGMMAEARRQIERLLKTKDAAELHNLLGEVEEKDGNFIAAADQYQRAAHLEPSEPNIFDWGSELLIHQTWNPAIEVFSEGVKRYPNSARLAVGLGLVFYWRANYDDAVKALVKATDLDPSDPRPYYFLSKAYGHSQSQADEVIERFRRFAQLHPRDGRAAYYYAMSLWKGKRTETSASHLADIEPLLKKAVEMDPSFAQAHLDLGNFYSQQRKYAEAVPEYQRAIKLNEKLVDAYYRLGQAYAQVGQKDLALKEFQIHQELYQKHLAEWDNEQQAIRQFVFTKKADSR